VRTTPRTRAKSPEGGSLLKSPASPIRGTGPGAGVLHLQQRAFDQNSHAGTTSSTPGSIEHRRQPGRQPGLPTAPQRGLLPGAAPDQYTGSVPRSPLK
jgi:hypothetical protein